MKTWWIAILCGLLLGLSGCSSQGEAIEETHFRQYYATEESDFYQVEGTVCQAKEDGVLFYLQPTVNERLDLAGTMTKQQGDLQLVYVAEDGTQTVLHDSRNGSSDKVDVTFMATEGIGSVRFLGTEAIFDFDLTLTGFSEENMAYLGGKLPALHETKGSAPLTEKGSTTEEKTASFSAMPQEEMETTEIGPLPQMEGGTLLAGMEELLTYSSTEQTVLEVEMEKETQVVLEIELYAQEKAAGVPLSDVWLEARTPLGEEILLLSYEAEAERETNQQWRGKYHNVVTLPKGVSAFVLSPIGGEEMQVGLSISVYEG